MDAEKLRLSKQVYLKSEIIDQGYDADAFISYCESRKSADIDEWSFDELKDCVSAFVSPTRKYSNADLLECKTLRETALTNQSIKVVITKPEKKPGTFSSKTFFYYVLTLPLGWSVQRKLTDFNWLIETLNNEYPGLYIPIKKEKSNKQLEDPLEMAVQVKQLSFLMDYITSSDLIKRSQSLIAFLQVEERPKFSKIKKIKIKKPQDTKNFSTADGHLTCEYDNLSEFTTKTSTFYDLFKDSLHKITHEGKNLKRILCELQISMNSFSSHFAELAQISNLMFVHSRAVSNLYNKLAETCTKLSEKIWNSTQVSYEYFHSTFKFFKSQGTVFKTLFKDKDALYVEIETHKKKIGKLVEKDKGVNKDLTDKMKALKEKAGVLNFMCKEQSERLLQYYVRIVFEQSVEFWTKSSSELTGMLTVLHSFQDVVEASRSLTT